MPGVEYHKHLLGMKAGSRRANALLQLTSNNSGAGGNFRNQQRQHNANHEGGDGKKTHLHRTCSWPPLPPLPSSLFVNEESGDQEQHKENSQLLPTKVSSLATSSSSSGSLDELDQLNMQQPLIIPPPTWAIPIASSSSSTMNTTSSEAPLATVEGAQKDAASKPQPILHSASLTSILDELNEIAESKRGLSIGETLVEINSCSSERIAADDDISTIVVGKTGSAQPSPLAEARTAPMTVAEPFNLSEMPTSNPKYVIASSSSSSSSFVATSGNRSELCFGCVDGRVTCVVPTADGTFIICGFSSGAVRLYDMTLSGNTDPEDRVGYLLTRHDSAQGFLQMHLEIGDISKNDMRFSHLFCGSKIGSTRMTVIDIEALRVKKIKRGFITTVGLQTMTHNDGRLRGFTSLATIYCEGINVHDGKNDMYAMKYRILTGLGYGNYNVWDVLIEKKICPDGSVTNNDYWSIAANGSVNGPTMTFGCIVTANPKALLSVWRKCSDNNTNLVTGDVDDKVDENGTTFEILFQSREKDLRVQRLDILMAEKSSVVKGMKNTINKMVHASSSDGSILFSGLDELIVQRYLPCRASVGGGAVVFTARFSLDSFSNENLIGLPGGNVSKRQRRMRQIETVRCATDGKHALVFCTDNSILVYSTVPQVDSNWRQPSSVQLDQPLDTLNEELVPEGALRYLYMVDASLKVELAIFTVPNLEQQEYLKHVFICISWWQVSAPSDGGCISVTGLDAAVAGAIPLAAVQSEGNRNGCCWQCGMKGLNHWEAVSDKGDIHKDTKLGSARDLNSNTGSQRIVAIDTKSNASRASKRKISTVSSTDSSCQEDVEHRSINEISNVIDRDAIANTDASTTTTCSDQEDKIYSLEVQLQEARDEIELVVRKADRRFEEEKRLRKAWNAERKALQDETTRLEASNKEVCNSLSVAQMEVSRLRKVVAKYNKHMSDFLRCMGLSEGALPFDVEPDSNCTTISTANEDISGNGSSSLCNDKNMVSNLPSSSSMCSPSNVSSSTPTIKAPFCVICQANTADVMIVDCGHICICHEHSLTMQNTGQLKTCPVCKGDVKAVCKVRGLEPKSHSTSR